MFLDTVLCVLNRSDINISLGHYLLKLSKAKNISFTAGGDFFLVHRLTAAHHVRPLIITSVNNQLYQII